MKGWLKIGIAFPLLVFAHFSHAGVPEYKKHLIASVSNWNCRIQMLHELPNGMILLGTECGLKYFDGKKVEDLPFMDNQSITGISSYSADSVIITTTVEIVLLNIKNFSSRVIYNMGTQQQSVISKSLRVRNTLYISSTGGLHKLDFKSKKLTHITRNIKDLNNDPPGSYRRYLQYFPENNQLVFNHSYGIIIYALDNNQETMIYRKEARDIRFAFPIKNGYIFSFANSKSNIFTVDLVHHTEQETGDIDSSILKSEAYAITEHNLFTSKPNNRYGIYSQQQQEMLYFYSKEVIAMNPLMCIYPSARYPRFYYLGVGTDLILLTPMFPNISPVKFEYNLPPLRNDHPTNNEGAFYSDSGIYLLGKNGSVLLFNSGLQKVEYNLYPPAAIQAEIDILSLKKYDADNLILFGNRGYCFFNIHTRSFYKKRLFEPRWDNLITDRNLLDIDKNNKRIIVSIYRKGLLIKNLENDSEFLFNGNDLKIFRTVRKIKAINEDEYFFGANGFDGLWRYNFKTGKSVYWDARLFASLGIRQPVIHCIEIIKDTAYVGTMQNIFKVNLKTHKIFDRITSNSIFFGIIYYIQKLGNKILVYNRNYIFLLENNKLVLLAKSSETESFKYIWKLHNTFYVYTNKNISILNLQLPPPGVFVNLIKTDNQYLVFQSLQNNLHFEENPKNISLHFGTSLPQYFLNNGHIYYKFKNENNWNKIADNVINLNSLRAGKYSLEFYIEWGNVRSQVQTFSFSIAPRWFESGWFYVSAVLLAILLTYLFVRQRLQAQNNRRKREIGNTLLAIEEERERLSQEFHDGIGPNLSTLKLWLDPANVQPMVERNTIKAHLDQTILSIRRIIQDLSPHDLDKDGLAVALQKYIHELQATGIAPRFISNLNIGNQRFSTLIEINLYRIAQELINNALKHAGAAEIHIDLLRESDKISLIITDDGRGFDIGQNASGFGLKNIQNRVATMNGKMDFSSSAEFGTSVVILVPIELPR